VKPPRVGHPVRASSDEMRRLGQPPKQTFAIRGHVVDLVTEEEDDEEAAK